MKKRSSGRLCSPEKTFWFETKNFLYILFFLNQNFVIGYFVFFSNWTTMIYKKQNTTFFSTSWEKKQKRIDPYQTLLSRFFQMPKIQENFSISITHKIENQHVEKRKNYCALSDPNHAEKFCLRSTWLPRNGFCFLVTEPFFLFFFKHILFPKLGKK